MTATSTRNNKRLILLSLQTLFQSVQHAMGAQRTAGVSGGLHLVQMAQRRLEHYASGIMEDHFRAIELNDCTP